MTMTPAPVLASNTTSSPSAGGVSANGTQLIAQSFVGAAGELQSVAISVSLGSTSALTPTVAIYKLDGATLGALVAEAQLTTPTISWSEPVPFGSGVALEVGQSYAIAVTYPRAAESDTFTWTALANAGLGVTCLRGPANGSGLTVVEGSVCDFNVTVGMRSVPTLGAPGPKGGLGAGKGINRPVN